MKCVALVAGHFPPSNLAGVHRARLWAQHLSEFRWKPVIVTADWRHYEENLDWGLAELVDPALKVIRTPALPTRPVRLVGDIGLRALPWLYWALADLARRGVVDFVHITIPSNYCALLGAWINHRFGVPYGIDFQDPWVEDRALREYPSGKAKLAQATARWLEPMALRRASLITSVAPGYIASLLARRPEIADRAVVSAMPIGGSEGDFEAVRRLDRPPWLFEDGDDLFRFIYAGTMWPAGLPILERFLEALAFWQSVEPSVTARVRVHFVGTGRGPDDRDGAYVGPLIRRLALESWVKEYPQRIGYVDVLNHLTQAGAVLVLGSTEAHYSPSKVFQAVLSRRSVLALLHEASSAVTMLREGRAGLTVTFGDGHLPGAEAIVAALRTIVDGRAPAGEAVRWEAFAAYSARESARTLANALDLAVQR